MIKNIDDFIMEKEKFADGRIRIMLTPKHMKCYGCGKEIEFKSANYLNWTDENGYKREQRFCLKCKIEIKPILDNNKE